MIIHSSLHRASLVCGGEREPVMMSALIALMVGAGGMTLISALVAGTFWLLALFVLRQAAKVDPLLIQVWLRHIKQQDFYAAQASPFGRGY